MALNGLSEVTASFDWYVATFCGIDGRQRAKIFSAEAFEKVALDGYTVPRSSWIGAEDGNYGDLLIKPDLSSLRAVPSKNQTGWVACDIYDDTLPSALCLRSALKKHTRNVEHLNVQTGVEVEFSLSANYTSNEFNFNPPNMALKAEHKTAHFLEQLINTLKKSSLLGASMHKESDPHQYEITWHQDSAIKTADNHIFARYLIQTVADSLGLKVLFTPLLKQGWQGNGCHVHISYSSTSHKALAVEKYAQQLCEQAPELSAITLPSINSMKRICGWYDRRKSRGQNPRAVLFSANERGELVRSTRHGTIEYRIADGATNSYMLQSIILSPLLQDFDKSATKSSVTYTNNCASFPIMPRFTYESIMSLSKSSVAAALFGKPTMDAFLKWRIREMEDFSRNITSWEIERSMNVDY